MSTTGTGTAQDRGPLFVELTRAAGEVAEGRYDAARTIFELTKPGQYPAEVGAVAEAFGMMAVKVEAREFRLERALDEIRRQNEAIGEAARIRAEFGTMATFIVIVLCLYTVALEFLQSVVKVDIQLRRAAIESISFGFLLIQIGMAAFFISRHRPSPEAYGWTLRNWKRSLVEALACTGLVLALLIAVKWLLVGHVAAYRGQPVADWSYWGGWPMVLSYLFVAPAQELIGRGVLQGSIERFLTGRHRTLAAILLTSVQFGVVHFHFSFEAGVIAMLSGLLFGAMYARSRTLLGVSVCHVVLGALAFGPLRLIG